MEQVAEILTDLVREYSPTGDEGKATDLFSKYLMEIGASDIHKDSVGNSIGTLPGEGISVTLCGHIDTVEGNLPVILEEGELKGRGAVDAKSSLISLLIGARVAKDRGFKGTLHIIAAVGEEGPGKGIYEVARTMKKTDYAILGEPSGTTGVTTGYRGRLLFRASFSSKSYHASAPWMGKNAIDMAIDAWRAIRKSYGNEREFSKVSAALTSINGGNGDNVLPSGCSITVDIRFPPSRKREKLAEEVRDLISEQSEFGEVQLELVSFVDPYVSNLKSPLVKAFKAAVDEIAGQKAKMIFKSGSGDMNILGTEWNIPAVTYGPGNPQLSHTSEEVISIEEVEKSVEVVANALLQLERQRA